MQLKDSYGPQPPDIENPPRSDASVTFLSLNVMFRRPRGLPEIDVCERRYLSYEGRLGGDMVSLQTWIYGEVLSENR